MKRDTVINSVLACVLISLYVPLVTFIMRILFNIPMSCVYAGALIAVVAAVLALSGVVYCLLTVD